MKKLTKHGNWYFNVKNEAYPFKELVPFVLGLSLMHDFDKTDSNFTLVLIVIYAILCVVTQFVSAGWKWGDK